MKPLALAEKAGAYPKMVAEKGLVVNRGVAVTARRDGGRMRMRTLHADPTFEPETGKDHPVFPRPSGLAPL